MIQPSATFYLNTKTSVMPVENSTENNPCDRTLLLLFTDSVQFNYDIKL
jgi:hypothetical protein